jgi:hypothetical protein
MLDSIGKVDYQANNEPANHQQFGINIQTSKNND